MRVHVPGLPALALIVVPWCAFCQEGVPDLSGVWLRKAATTADPAHPAAELRVKIEQHGAEVTVTFRSKNNGTDETNVEHLLIGSDNNRNKIHGAPMISKAAWDGPTLVVDSVAKFGDQELRMNNRWTLSGDRKRLTFVQSHQFGAEPKATTDTYVLERQAEESWEAAPAAQAAEQVYRNIQMLKGTPAESLPATMVEFSRALGVACTHCHVEGAMEDDGKPTLVKARRMMEMRSRIAQSAEIELDCWTCHRGHAVPQAGPASDASLWPAELNLPEERGSEPVSKVYKNIKFFNSTAASLKTAMLFMSASLGTGCSHCHIVSRWESDDKPAKDIARKMLAMVRDTRAEFPDIRTGCFTCHHGASKPETAPGMKN